MYDARMLLSRHAYTCICFDVRSMSGSHASYYIKLLIIFNYQGRLGDNAVHETGKLRCARCYDFKEIYCVNYDFAHQLSIVFDSFLHLNDQLCTIIPTPKFSGRGSIRYGLRVDCLMFRMFRCHIIAARYTTDSTVIAPVVMYEISFS
jgi:hypothetical protein